MLENGKISVQQLTTLALLITVGDSILVLPAIPAVEAKQDAWLSMLLGILIGVLIAYSFTLLARLYPTLTLVECNRKILGKVIGTVVSLFFLLYLFISAATHIREVGDFVITSVMPETPMLAIQGLLLLIIIMAVRYGLETYARSAEILHLLFIILFFFLIFTLIPKIEIKNLQPILEEGFKPVVRGSFTAVAFPFMDLIVFLMIFPYVNPDKTQSLHFLFGVLRGGFILFVIIILCILVLGPEHTAKQLYPSYMLAKEVGIGQVLQRVESILALMWMISTFFKVTLYVYALHLGLGQLLELKDYRSLTLPMAMLILLCSLIISPNPTFFFVVISKYWAFYALTIAVGLPLLIFLVDVFRKRIIGSKMN